jgi:tRNA dimethylallyltransferase
LALAWAEQDGGIVINADSAQLYADLAVLSARPAAADTARAEHRLFGVRDAAQPCSAAEWAALARAEIARAHGSGRLPILVGGTGLYLRTLLDGIAPVPAIDTAIREEVRAAPVGHNRARLAQLDPAAATRLAHGDTARIARALEVALSTGRPLAWWQAQRENGIGQDITLLPSRAWLYERCNRRFAAMLDGGAVEEVRALLARGLDPALPSMRAIGVREIGCWLRGEWTKEQALAAGAQATRNYAKRQYTWFAQQPPPEWPRFSEALADEEATARALALLTAAV